MRAALHIAFDKKIADLLVRASEYVSKYGGSLSPYFETYYMDYDAVSGNDKLTVRQPRKISQLQDAALLSLDFALGGLITFDEMTAGKDYLQHEIDEFFDRCYARFANVDRPEIDSRLSVFLYLPIYENNVSNSVSFVLRHLSKGHKFNVNVVTISYDVARCIGITGHIYPDSQKIITKDNLLALAALKETDSRIDRILVFQNYNKVDRALNHTKDSVVSILAELCLLSIEHYTELYPNSGSSKPITTLNLVSETVDVDSILNTWFQNLIESNLSDYRLNDETMDREKILNAYREIIDKEKEFIKKYIDNCKTSDNEQVFLPTFIEKVKIPIIDIIKNTIANKNLNYSEIHYLLSLFEAPYEDPNISYDDVRWDIEGFEVDSIYGPDSDVKKMLNSLRRYAKDIEAYKIRIQNIKNAIEEIQAEINEPYEYDGTLTDDGFVIGSTVYKPYYFKEKLFTEDYAVTDVTELPPSIDLRPYFSAIRDQGNQGSCTSFSMVSVYEYFIRCANKANVDLSEAFVYFNSREIDGETDKDCGSTFYNAVLALQQKGVCIEELCVYNDKEYNVRPSDEAYNEGRNRIVKEAKNVRININDIKYALSQRLPVIISVKVYDSIINNINGFIQLPTSTNQKKESYHAMVICGYSDSEGYFIVRNSWGKNFGDNGYCYLPYAYIRESKLLEAACVITGINADLELSHSLEGNSLLKDRDSYAQKVIYENILAEKSRELQIEMSGLKQAQKKYVELFNYIGGKANLDITIAEIESKTKSEIESLERQLEQLSTESNEIDSDKNPFHFFKNRRRRKDNVGKVKKHEEEISVLKKQMQEESTIQLINSALISGLSNLKDDLLTELSFVKRSSGIVERLLNDIAMYREINHNFLMPSYMPSLSEFMADNENLFSVINQEFNVLKGEFKAFVNREKSIVDVIQSVQSNVMQLLFRQFQKSIDISKYVDSASFQPFINQIRTSNVMVRLHGTVQAGTDQGYKLFFSSQNIKPIGFKNDNIKCLPISTPLRMSFLHFEKYDVEDLAMLYGTEE